MAAVSRTGVLRVDVEARARRPEPPPPAPARRDLGSAFASARGQGPRRVAARARDDPDWHLRACGISGPLPAPWREPAKTVRIALLDTGIDGTLHSARIAPVHVVGAGQAVDPRGHGTEMASILDRLLDDAGARDVEILPIAVLDETSRASELDLVQALEHAERSGCRVIACPWFVQCEAPALRARIGALRDAIVVTAIANGSLSLDVEPSAQWLAFDAPASLVVVGATDARDRWPLAHGARTVHLGAPGVDVHCPVRRRRLSGASISAVLVAGVLALAARHSGVPRAPLIEALLHSARRSPPCRGRCRSEGVVDLAGLLAELRRETPLREADRAT